MQFAARDRLLIVRIELTWDDAIKDAICAFSESQQICVLHKFVDI